MFFFYAVVSKATAEIVFTSSELEKDCYEFLGEVECQTFEITYYHPDLVQIWGQIN